MNVAYVPSVIEPVATTTFFSYTTADWKAGTTDQPAISSGRGADCAPTDCAPATAHTSATRPTALN